MEKLRANKIEFSVSVNPTPEEDEGDSDVFWFSANADIDKIQSLINEGMKKLNFYAHRAIASSKLQT